MCAPRAEGLLPDSVTTDAGEIAFKAMISWRSMKTGDLPGTSHRHGFRPMTALNLDADWRR